MNLVDDVELRVLAAAAVRGMIEAGDPAGAVLTADRRDQLTRRADGVRGDRDVENLISATLAELARRGVPADALPPGSGASLAHS